MRRTTIIAVLFIALATTNLASASSSDHRDSDTPDNRIQFDIAEQPLGSALNQFALQSGQEILFLPRLTASLRSRELHATLSVDNALELLLAPSGLAYRRINHSLNNSGFLIEAAPQPNRTSLLASTTTLTSVVVTATRTGTLLQNTPMSLNVLTDDELVDAGVSNLNAIAMLLPSLNQSRTSSADTHRFTVRGVLGPGETTTGIYYNDIPVSGPTGTTADAGMALPELRLIDVKRIELLRGPQGTLYGAGAMGGSLRVLFNEPSLDRTEVWARTQASLTQSNAGTQFRSNTGDELSAAINVPLPSLHAAARIVAYRDTTPGYIDNTVLHLRNTNAESVTGLRASFTANIADHANLLFTAVRQQGRASDAVTWSLNDKTFSSDAAVRMPFENDFSLYSLRLRWQFDTGQLQLNSAHYSWDLVRRLNYTDVMLAQRTSLDACARYLRPTPMQSCNSTQLNTYSDYVDANTPALLEQPMNVAAWIHELLWHGRRGNSIAWTTGIYVEERKDSAEGNTLAADPTTGLPRLPLYYIGRRTLQHRLTQNALFGEVEFAIAPRAHLTLGARAYDYAKSGTADVTVSNYVSGLVAPSSLVAESHADGTSFKLLLSRELRDGLLIYAQAAQGFRPGGVNFNPGLAPDAVQYRSDSLWSYEFGLKSTWLDNLLATNIAVYQIDRRDMQYIVVTSNGASRYLANVGKARNNGVEADIALQATNHLRVNIHANYTDARLAQDQATGAPSGLGQRGDRIPVIPQWAGSTTAEYQHELNSSLQLSVRLDASYLGSAYTGFNSSNSEYAALDSAALVNFRIAINPCDDPADWHASIFIDNLLNRQANTQVLNNLSGPPQASGPRPRTVGIGFDWRFK